MSSLYNYYQSSLCCAELIALLVTMQSDMHFSLHEAWLSPANCATREYSYVYFYNYNMLKLQLPKVKQTLTFKHLIQENINIQFLLKSTDQIKHIIIKQKHEY